MEKINDFNGAKNLLEKYLDKKISINKLKKRYFFPYSFGKIYLFLLKKIYLLFKI